jgi:hypothetical protein
MHAVRSRSLPTFALDCGPLRIYEIEALIQEYEQKVGFGYMLVALEKMAPFEANEYWPRHGRCDLIFTPRAA